MYDYDVIIIGGGPAGLTAGLYLTWRRHRTLLIEKESYGGKLKDIDRIEDYPGFAEGVSGAQLASEMESQATRQGLQLEPAEVTGIELYSSSKWVQCASGKGFTAAALIIASGCSHRKLGVPCEKELLGKGVINCVLCDGGLFTKRVVAVCGGGDTGITQALYLTKFASRVIVIEKEATLSAAAVLKERTLNNPKIEVRCGLEVTAISGNERVEAIEVIDAGSGQKDTLKVDGVLVHIGGLPNTGYLSGIVPLDEEDYILVNNKMETEVAGVFAAGDIRHDSTRRLPAAVGDGSIAALAAGEFLQNL